MYNKIYLHILRHRLQGKKWDDQVFANEHKKIKYYRKYCNLRRLSSLMIVLIVFNTSITR